MTVGISKAATLVLMTTAVMRLSIVMMNNLFHTELKNGTHIVSPCLQRGRGWMSRGVKDWSILKSVSMGRDREGG